MSNLWLDRDTVLAPYMTLCLTEAEYLAVAARCKLAYPLEWLSKGMQACVHTWEYEGNLTCVVCLSPEAQKNSPIDIAESLIHEAVHVFQRLCDSIGETNPSSEFEAYSIQRIAGQLLREYARRIA